MDLPGRSSMQPRDPSLPSDQASLLELWRPAPSASLHLAHDVMTPLSQAHGRSFMSAFARLLARGFITVGEDPYMARLTEAGVAWLSARGNGNLAGCGRDCG